MGGKSCPQNGRFVRDTLWDEDQTEVRCLEILASVVVILAVITRPFGGQ